MSVVIIVQGVPDMEDGHQEIASVVGPFADEPTAIAFAAAHPDVVQECGRGVGCCFTIFPIVAPSA